MVREREFYKTIFKIALPAAMQALISFLVIVADDIMVSFLEDGVNAQAAVSQVNSITTLYTATILGLVGGSAVLISQYWGKRDMKPVKRVFSIVIIICFGFSLAIAAAAKLFPREILSVIISTKDVRITELARSYFAVACFSYIPFALSAAMVGMLRTIEVVRITMYTAAVSLVTNIVFNYILIFGKIGFPSMGVQGAAVATLLSRLVELALVWAYTFHVQKRLQIRPADIFKTDRAMMRDYLKYGLPVGIVDMQWAFIGMLKAAIVGRMGAVFIASNSIAGSMANLGTIFTFALAGGACVVIGKAVGLGDYKRAREYSRTIQIMFFFAGLLMAAAVFLLRVPFVSMYGSSSDPAVRSLSVTLVAVLSVTMIGTTYHASCFVGINRGAGDSRFVALVDMVCGWLIVLPATLLAVFVFKWSMPVVFLCTRIDQCFKWIIALIRLRGNKWIRNVTRETA